MLSSVCYQHTSELNYNLLQFASLDKFTDVEFVVGERRFRANKAVFAASSEVFLAMFESGMKEDLSGEVVLEDVEPDVFQEYRRFVYTGESPNMSKYAVPLLILADKYRTVHLVDCCVNYLEETVNEINACERLLVAQSLSLDSLISSCISKICCYMETVSETRDWKQVLQYPDLATKIASFYEGLVKPNGPILGMTKESLRECVLGVSTFTSIKWVIPEVSAQGGCFSDKFSLVASKKKLTGFRLRCRIINHQTIRFDIEKPYVPYDYDSTDCLAELLSDWPEGGITRSIRVVLEGGGIQRLFEAKITPERNQFIKNGCYILKLSFPTRAANMRLVSVDEPRAPDPKPVLSRSDLWADVTLEVGQSKFPVHKFILASQSPYFAKLFSEKTATHYELISVSESAFDIILDYLYIGKPPSSSLIDLSLVKAAGLLGLELLVQHCSPVCAGLIDIDNAAISLIVAQAAGAKHLQNAANNFITNHLNAVMSTKGWSELLLDAGALTSLFIHLSNHIAMQRNTPFRIEEGEEEEEEE